MLAGALRAHSESLYQVPGTIGFVVRRFCAAASCPAEVPQRNIAPALPAAALALTYCGVVPTAYHAFPNVSEPDVGRFVHVGSVM